MRTTPHRGPLGLAHLPVALPPPTYGPHYRPIAVIGRGGMAEAILALVRDADEPRLAVLKCIRPELAADPDFVTMFKDEASLALVLRHPNIVETYEILAGDDQLAIAMEFLDGQPLGRLLSRLRGPGPIPLAQRLRVVSLTLDALDYAHGVADDAGVPLGVVHRDVGPQNIFLTCAGQVKLVDFGVAKTIAASHYTRPGTIKGRLHYMAPEQFWGGQVDGRADLFSVGVVLWELLASQRLWGRMSEGEIAMHLTSGGALPPLPDDVGGHGFGEICRRALARDAGERYQTAAEMKADIDAACGDLPARDERDLGDIVAASFAKERAQIRGLIAAHVSGERRTPPAGAILPHVFMSGSMSSFDIEPLAAMPPGGRGSYAAAAAGRSPAFGAPEAVAPAAERPRPWVPYAAGGAGLALALLVGTALTSSWRITLERVPEETVAMVTSQPPRTSLGPVVVPARALSPPSTPRATDAEATTSAARESASPKVANGERAATGAARRRRAARRSDAERRASDDEPDAILAPSDEIVTNEGRARSPGAGKATPDPFESTFDRAPALGHKRALDPSNPFTP